MEIQGAVFAPLELPSEALFNTSWERPTSDATFVLSNSPADKVVQKLTSMGVLRAPALLKDINLLPVFSIGSADEGMPYHRLW